MATKKRQRLCQNAGTTFFYAQSPDFLKPGLCYYQVFIYSYFYKKVITMTNNSRKTIFTTISIDKETAALVEKICKRYSLKKSEVVKLTFGHIDEAHINLSEAPESIKSELAKISKRQDDIIRFIHHYEEESHDTGNNYYRFALRYYRKSFGNSYSLSTGSQSREINSRT